MAVRVSTRVWHFVPRVTRGGKLPRPPFGSVSVRKPTPLTDTEHSSNHVERIDTALLRKQSRRGYTPTTRELLIPASHPSPHVGSVLRHFWPLPTPGSTGDGQLADEHSTESNDDAAHADTRAAFSISGSPATTFVPAGRPRGRLIAAAPLDPPSATPTRPKVSTRAKKPAQHAVKKHAQRSKRGTPAPRRVTTRAKARGAREHATGGIDGEDDQQREARHERCPGPGEDTRTR